MAQIDSIKRDRLEKLKKIRKIGWDPYVSKFDKKHTIAECIKREGDTVKTAGKIYSYRTHGEIAFADLKDETGKIQIFFRKSVLRSEAFSNLRLLDVGDYIGVEGEVAKTKTGEISIVPTQYKLLTKSLRPLPHEWYGLKDVETRYRKRYLDLLMNKELRRVFDTRSRIVKAFREYLDSHGFIEVETPVLQPIYGGATARPFITHHNALDCEFYLRVADELYLKRLLVGGYEKVYELGKDFRNEGLSRWHSPEFSQLEFYWAYADYEDLMKFTEKMLSYIVQEIKGSMNILYNGQKIDFTPPWDRKKFSDLFNEFLKLDIEQFDTEEKLSKFAKDKELLETDVSGYGYLLDTIYKKHIRPQLKGPVFITDHPVELKPLAKRSIGNESRSASFQLVVVGAEIVNAYNELNDPMDQRERWKDEMEAGKKGAQEYQVIDEDFIEALEYGMPPTAGWGLGIARFCALLTDQHTIKDVILFPTLRPVKDK